MQLTGIKFQEYRSSGCREFNICCEGRADEETMTDPTHGSESSCKDGTIVNDTAFYSLTGTWNGEQKL